MSCSVRWKPSASVDNLVKRANIIKEIRQFFYDRKFLEVETPSLSQSTVTDTYIVPFRTKFINLGIMDKSMQLYLITSPEYHMKRLLASESGPIFQICHSFRNGEFGRYHNPEFTMLEWYRPNYNMNALMQEVDNFLHQFLNYQSSEMFSYQEVFMKYVGIDPLSINKKELYKEIVKWHLNEAVSDVDDCDTLLQLLFSVIIRKHISTHNNPVFIYHFPASQSHLAGINSHDCRISDRFEVYFRNIEIANGFRELTDVNEQRERFKQENYKRRKLLLSEELLDENLLAALEHGMPQCSGVALGVDRLIMLVLKTKKLSDVISFSLDRA